MYVPAYLHIYVYPLNSYVDSNSINAFKTKSESPALTIGYVGYTNTLNNTFSMPKLQYTTVSTKFPANPTLRPDDSNKYT